MRRSTLALLLATGLLTTLSQAGAGTPTPVDNPAAAVTPSNDPNQKICRTRPYFGSHLMTRECRTKREWAQLRFDGRQGLEHAQEFSGFGSNRGR